MSPANANEDSTVWEGLRTVTPLTTEGPNVQMNLFGYLVAIPILLLLLPLLPFIVAGWVVVKAAGILRG